MDNRITIDDADAKTALWRLVRDPGAVPKQLGDFLACLGDTELLEVYDEWVDDLVPIDLPLWEKLVAKLRSLGFDDVKGRLSYTFDDEAMLVLDDYRVLSALSACCSRDMYDAGVQGVALKAAHIATIFDEVDRLKSVPDRAPYYDAEVEDYGFGNVQLVPNPKLQFA